MGLFNFLKKKELEVISFDEIENWLDTYLDRKDLNTRLGRFKEELLKQKEFLSGSLNELNETSLMNPDIPERAKHIMQGNKDEYIRKMKAFIEIIDVPGHYRDIGFFSSKLSEDIDGLGEKTQKNFFVLREFFEREVSKIAKIVKKMEDNVIDFRQELEKENLDEINGIRSMLKQLEDDIITKKDIRLNKVTAENTMKNIMEKEKKIIAKIEELKNSSGHQKLKDLKEKKEKLNNVLEDMKKELKSDFSTLERALKKYAHNSPDEKIVSSYLEDPVESLNSDPEIKISQIIFELSEKLADLDIKGKKENIQKVIEKLTKDHLESKKSDIKKIREDINTANVTMKGNTTILNISEQETFLKDIERKKEEQEEEMQEVENQLERINVSLSRQKIKAKVKELGDVDFRN